MQAHSPGAFFLSLTLHSAVVAVILFLTFAVHQQIKETPKIFELVAGEGDDYMASEAPAASGADEVQFTMPKIARPSRTEPTPARSEPQIIDTLEPTKPSPRKTEAKSEVKKAPTKTEPKAEQPKKMTKAQFDKLHANQKNPTAAAQPRGVNPKKINIAGVIGGSANSTRGAGGRALTRAEGEALDAYIALLLQKLRAAHIKPVGLSDLLQAKVRFNIAANGTLSNVRIITSSGSREFDQSVLETFAQVRSIGATPNGKADVWEVTFKMREDD